MREDKGNVVEFKGSGGRGRFTPFRPAPGMPDPMSRETGLKTVEGVQPAYDQVKHAVRNNPRGILYGFGVLAAAAAAGRMDIYEYVRSMLRPETAAQIHGILVAASDWVQNQPEPLN